jgi:hypothetical protein
MKFEIKGNIEGISKEEIRAVFHACDVILQYHNVRPLCDIITVKLTNEDLGLTKTGDKVVGNANIKECIIKIINEKRTFSSFVTIALHEMIHLYFRFPDGIEEKLTSTLTSKLKSDVVRILNILVENTYKRAAFIAHTKISYLPEGTDFYDNDQYRKDHEESKGKKYRNKNIVKVMG